MEKIRIRYYSKLGHTKKIADYIAKYLKLEAKEISDDDFIDGSEILFLGGAPYANVMDKKLKEYVEKLRPKDAKRVVLFTTSNWSRRTALSIKKTLKEKGLKVDDKYLYVHMLKINSAEEKTINFIKKVLNDEE